MSSRTLYVTVSNYITKEGVAVLRQATPQTDSDTGEIVENQPIDEIRVDLLICRACDIVDSILGGAFSVPLSLPVPGIIEEIVIHMVNEWIVKDDLNPSMIVDYEQPPFSTLIAIKNGVFTVPGLTKSNVHFESFDSIPDYVEDNSRFRFINFDTGRTI